MELASARERVGFVDAVRWALAVGGVLFLFSGLDNYVFLVFGGPRPVLYVGALVLASAAIAIINLERRSELLRSPVLAWTLAFAMLTTLWGLWVKSDPAAVQVIDDRYRSMALLLAFAVLFDDERTRRAATLAVAVAVAAAALLNVAEVAGVDLNAHESVQLNRIAGRPSGFYINPNRAGLAITIGLAVCGGAVPPRLRLPLTIVAAAGVAATLSRGASLCFIIVVLSLMWRGALRPWPTLVVLSGVAAALALSTGPLMSFLDSRGALNEDTLARLQLAADDSGRGELARKAFRLFEESPLLGHGLGVTRLWDTSLSSHNMYLELAASQGVLGLLAFPALALAIVLAQRRVSPVAVTLVVAGVFSHHLLEEAHILVPIALSAFRASTAAIASEAPSAHGQVEHA